MLRHYLTLAAKVFLRRKFFTFISIFGISLTLLVLMVATAVLDHVFAPMAPETRQDRTLGVHRAKMTGRDGWAHFGDPGFKLLDRYARNLPGVEHLSIYSQPHTVDSFLSGQKIQSSLKRTDADFWKILDFSFIEGAPYSSQDVAEARFVAIINRTTRSKFFGGQPAVGKTIEADGQRFRVMGVVEDVSVMRFIPFADIWVPHTTAKSDAYRKELMSGFNAIALARDRSAFPHIQEEFNSRLRRMEFDDSRFDTMVAPFGTKFEMIAQHAPFASRRDPASQAWKLRMFMAFAAALFLLLPTVNLININVSRIMERSSEIGIRKAFGASSRTLVGQFVLENVLLTLVGGLVGFALSALVLRALNESGAVAYTRLGLNLRVFLYGLLLAVSFGIMSGVYPAWRMSRLHPVDALKGSTR